MWDQNLQAITWAFFLSLILIKNYKCALALSKSLSRKERDKLFSLSTITQQLFMIFLTMKRTKKKSGEDTIKAFFAHHKSHLLAHNDNR